MKNVSQRLTDCFTNVFPDIEPGQIPNATAEKVEAWDSVAHITLLSAISEEFGIELEAEDYEELTSYRTIAEYLQKAHVQ
jgi:acyl carrier protein